MAELSFEGLRAGDTFDLGTAEGVVVLTMVGRGHFGRRTPS